MERIQSINPDRIRWCCNDNGITTDELAPAVGMAHSTLEKVMDAGGGLTFNQLRKLATYFGRGVLFFLESTPVRPTQVRTPQFRTIANQKPGMPLKIKTLIERAEAHREIYLSLVEDLDESDYPNFRPPHPLPKRPVHAASIARDWLGLGENNDFNTYRQAVEAKGILVFLTLGYSGQWQIPKESPIVGFSIYHPTCPVILIRKQPYDTRQSFTLMHELGHVLLHRNSFIDEQEDLDSDQGRERIANSFAGHLLVPDAFLERISDTNRPENVSEYGNWLQHYREQWGVGVEVLLRRMLAAGRLAESDYVAYREWLKRLPLQEPEGGSREWRHREPRHILGDRFVRTVLDALHDRQITLNRASTYLDNLKIKDLHLLEQFYAGI